MLPTPNTTVLREVARFRHLVTQASTRVRNVEQAVNGFWIARGAAAICFELAAGERAANWGIRTTRVEQGGSATQVSLPAALMVDG